ncbi:MAG: type I-B CRISPR-associated protein Cas7/Csh2 [Dictyoglomus sp. NZ13-RE01]|nr:MAG: type I-B CRISPR-associated protein Cas7/Csh2 [Dictyoglomus sp. NZ13-RE01]
MSIYSKNSEILFLYDAKMTNPNGDPDDENKPRMDYEKEVNLVSDVRLKRYVRDYLESIGYEIFVAKVDGEIVKATERLKRFFEKENKKVDLNKLTKEDINFLLSKLIDVRLFGATMPIEGEKKERGASYNLTGPVQFTWGYSLNKVELVRSSSITSTFAGKKEEFGTFGKDWRLYYSLIAFYGIVSGYRAQYTNLSEDDVKLLDKAMIEGINLMASTRSKVGQKPRFLLRVEYKDKNTFLGDMRGKIILDKVDGLRDISDYEVDMNKLKAFLESNKEKIEKIYIFEDDELKVKGGPFKEQLKATFSDKVVSIQ